MLLLTDTSVNVESLIGTLMMIGIVVANSVLLVDFANRRASEGVSVEEAVVEAGQVRIRPILMTALAASLGSFLWRWESARARSRIFRLLARSSAA